MFMNMYIDIGLARKKGLNYAAMYSAIREAVNASDSEDRSVHLTADDLQRLTSLTRRQQDLVIAKMVDDGLIEVEKREIPCKRYFRIVKEVQNV